MSETGDAARNYLGNESSVLDVLYDKALLDPNLQDDPGLVTIITKDGYAVCPEEQFLEDANGKLSLRSALGSAWAAARVIDAQLGEDAYATLARFTSPRAVLQGRSWWEVLVDDEVNEDAALLEQIKRDLIVDARLRNAVIQDGVLGAKDPRTTLPEL